MSATDGRRGMVMILVLVLVALLLIVALAIITGANTAILSATAVSVKYRVLNAAEGAVNVALNDVASDPGEPDGKILTGSLNNVAYSAYVVSNNLLQSGTKQATDPATGNPITVPGDSAYLYGVASDSGGHTTYVESIAVPTPPLTMPDGTINAAGDIQDQDPMKISSDPTDTGNPNDAILNADGNIFAPGTPSVVQGYTYAGSEDQVPSVNGSFNTLTAPLNFPSAPQVAEAARTAQLSAQAGNNYTALQVETAGTKTYTGNVYINGDVDLTAGTATFSEGTYVYVNGNLCISGGAQVVDANTGVNEFVVSGTVYVASDGSSYSAMPKANSMLLVLGTDSPQDECSGSNGYAVDLAAAAPDVVGTIYTPVSSVYVSGPSSIVGALDAGSDVYIDGSDTKVGMQYDTAQQSTTLDTGALEFSSYIEPQ
jgi:hypothetical protein